MMAQLTVEVSNIYVRWPGRSRSQPMSFERLLRCAQDTTSVLLKEMMQLAF